MGCLVKSSTLRANVASVARQEVFERLGAQVQDELSGRLRDFRLKGKDEGVVLTSRVRSYYAEQLAQYAVVTATALPCLKNEIHVL